MYAIRRLDVRQWEEQPEAERYLVSVARDGSAIDGIDANNITVVDEEVMYWRKANQVHNWFVRHVQNGEDDCREHYVSPDSIHELFKTCAKVMEVSKLVDGMVYIGTTYDADHPNGLEEREPGQVIEDPTVARKLLPTTEGFFFGSVEYDEGYLKQVTDTFYWCMQMIKEMDDGVPGNVYYLSSW